jgi:hypothetical protein
MSPSAGSSSPVRHCSWPHCGSLRCRASDFGGTTGRPQAAFAQWAKRQLVPPWSREKWQNR